MKEEKEKTCLNCGSKYKGDKCENCIVLDQYEYGG